MHGIQSYENLLHLYRMIVFNYTYIDRRHNITYIYKCKHAAIEVIYHLVDNESSMRLCDVACFRSIGIHLALCMCIGIFRQMAKNVNLCSIKSSVY